MKAILKVPKMTVKPIAGRPIPQNKDYEILENKPSINGVELTGNKTTKDLGIEIPEVDLSEYVKDTELDEKLNNFNTGIHLVKSDELILYNSSDGLYIMDKSIKVHFTKAKFTNLFKGQLLIKYGNYAIYWASNVMNIHSVNGGNTNYSYYLNAPSTSSSYIVTSDKVLAKNNTTSYTPTANYHPSTKKYVDDKIAELEARLSALENPTQ